MKAVTDRLRIADRVRRLRQGLIRGRPRIAARHAEWSVISSADDLWPPVPDELVGIALRAVERARTKDLSEVALRAGDGDRRFLETWPGEHYRLLAALAEELQPEVAVEIGTFTGMGALSLAEGLGQGSRLITYDLVPWRAIPGTLLRDEDFEGRMEQRLVDLQDERKFEHELPTLRQAGLIFVDGPKDGTFEPRFVSHLLTHLRGQPIVLVFDDIRLLAMVELWRELPLPRLDLTSFGHWSGTGLCLLS